MPFTSGIGLPEILIILVLVLIVFGPKRLPELGRSMGKGLREFKDSVSHIGGDDHNDPPEVEGGAVKPDDAPLEGEVVHNRKS